MSDHDINMDDMTAPISKAKVSGSPPGGWLQYVSNALSEYPEKTHKDKETTC